MTPRPMMDEERTLAVGICADCGDEVVLDRARLAASCPCGKTTIPPAFFAVASGERS